MALRLLGLALLSVMLLAAGLSWAFYTKAFTPHDDVKLTTTKSGLSLPERADVKLRGMIVGTVRETKIDDGKIVLTLGMDPKLIDRVPRDVRAEIIPKTLFGEKYVSLIPTAGGTGEHLRAGDTITDAVVPVEFEKFFNDVYPLLTAVPPEDVAYSLTALANSLEGRGEGLGRTFEDANDYLRKFNPENQQAVDDLIALGKVSQSYAGQMDDFGELLENSARVSQTVVDKEDDSADFYTEGDKLAKVLRDFLDTAGDDITATAADSVQPLEVGAEYSTMFPCWFKAQNELTEVTNQVFSGGTLHGALSPITKNPQPTRYGLPGDPQPEHPVVPTEAQLESLDFLQPEIHGYTANPRGPDNPYPAGLGTICDELNAAASGTPRRKPLPYPASYWKLFGITNSHNGFLGEEADYNR